MKSVADGPICYLASPITAADTTMRLAWSPQWRAPQGSVYTVRLNNELVEVTGISNSGDHVTASIVRGKGGTTPSAHRAKSPVWPVLSSDALEAIASESAKNPRIVVCDGDVPLARARKKINFSARSPFSIASTGSSETPELTISANGTADARYVASIGGADQAKRTTINIKSASGTVISGVNSEGSTDVTVSINPAQSTVDVKSASGTISGIKKLRFTGTHSAAGRKHGDLLKIGINRSGSPGYVPINDQPRKYKWNGFYHATGKPFWVQEGYPHFGFGGTIGLKVALEVLDYVPYTAYPSAGMYVDLHDYVPTKPLPVDRRLTSVECCFSIVSCDGDITVGLFAADRVSAKVPPDGAPTGAAMALHQFRGEFVALDIDRQNDATAYRPMLGQFRYGVQASEGLIKIGDPDYAGARYFAPHYSYMTSGIPIWLKLDATGYASFSFDGSTWMRIAATSAAGIEYPYSKVGIAVFGKPGSYGGPIVMPRSLEICLLSFKITPDYTLF